MFRLPYTTHRFFLEPLSATRHAIFSMYVRFIKFTESLQSSPKSLLRNLLNLLKHDCRSTTGANLRKIMLLVGRTRIEDLSTEDITKLCYRQIPMDEEWKLNLVKEITESRYGKLVVPNFSKSEYQDILHHVCTS